MPPTKNIFPLPHQQQLTLELLKQIDPTETLQIINNLDVKSRKIKLHEIQIRIQLDGGANTSVSNNLSIFSTSWEIPDYFINGVHADFPIKCN